MMLLSATVLLTVQLTSSHYYAIARLLSTTFIENLYLALKISLAPIGYLPESTVMQACHRHIEAEGKTFAALVNWLGIHPSHCFYYYADKTRLAHNFE